MEDKKTTENQTEAATKTGNKAKNNPKPARWEQFLGYISGSLFTNQCIAAFTLVLAVAAIYQFIIMNGQLDTMRIDQRAWLKFEAYSNAPGGDRFDTQITTGQPITYPLRVINSGKTPARNIDMKIFLDIVDASQEPPLSHVEESSHVPHGHIMAGIVFPNTDYKQLVVRPGDDASPKMATEGEVIAIRDGKAYLAVYGIIAYDDVFNTHHWTRFCDWIATNGQFHTQRCTQYNSVDSN